MCQLVPNRVQHLFIWAWEVLPICAPHHSDATEHRFSHRQKCHTCQTTNPGLYDALKAYIYFQYLDFEDNPTTWPIWIWDLEWKITLVGWSTDWVGIGQPGWLVNFWVEDKLIGMVNPPCQPPLSCENCFFFSECMSGWESMRKLRVLLTSKRERVRRTPWNLKDDTGRLFTDVASRKV